MMLLIKREDGPVSRHLNRRLSMLITLKILYRTSLTPNQVTFIVFVITLSSLPAYLSGIYWLGGLLAQLGSMLDGCDGELARLKGMSSERGAFYDTVLDRYSDILVTMMVTYRLCIDFRTYAWIPGFLAAVGGIMTSYTATILKYRVGMDIKWPLLLSDGRDVRMLLLALGSFLAHLSPLYLVYTLSWIAFVTNLKVAYRLVKATEILG